MTFSVQPSGACCGAMVTGIDLRDSLSAETVAELRAAWLAHKVLCFPEQQLDDDDLERFTGYFGGFGEDPFIAPIAGREHIIAVERRAQEKAPLFAENWHTDWSFQVHPPAGTCLLGLTIPPRGGDTYFADQQAAWQALPESRKDELRPLVALHSARAAYAPEGMYGADDQATDRSMDIRPDESANALQRHPLVSRHPETGEEGLYGCIGYIVGIEGMDDEAAFQLLVDLLEWQTRDEFVYRHEWKEKMLVMWDNRAVLHRASGGYEGYDRLLHRTTIRAWEPAAA